MNMINYPEKSSSISYSSNFIRCVLFLPIISMLSFPMLTLSDENLNKQVTTQVFREGNVVNERLAQAESIQALNRTRLITSTRQYTSDGTNPAGTGIETSVELSNNPGFTSGSDSSFNIQNTSFGLGNCDACIDTKDDLEKIKKQKIKNEKAIEDNQKSIAKHEKTITKTKGKYPKEKGERQSSASSNGITITTVYKYPGDGTVKTTTTTRSKGTKDKVETGQQSSPLGLKVKYHERQIKKLNKAIAELNKANTELEKKIKELEKMIEDCKDPDCDNPVLDLSSIVYSDPGSFTGSNEQETNFNNSAVGECSNDETSGTAVSFSDVFNDIVAFVNRCTEGVTVHRIDPNDGGVDTQILKTGAGTSEIVAGDLNQDDIVDISVFNSVTGMAFVYLANPNGSMELFEIIADAGKLQNVKAGDVNSDGFTDLVGRNSSSGEVEVLMGNGQGAVTYSKTGLIVPLGGLVLVTNEAGNGSDIVMINGRDGDLIDGGQNHLRRFSVFDGTNVSATLVEELLN